VLKPEVIRNIYRDVVYYERHQTYLYMLIKSWQHYINKAAKEPWC